MSGTKCDIDKPISSTERGWQYNRVGHKTKT